MTTFLRIALIIVNIALGLGMWFIASKAMSNEHLVKRDNSKYSQDGYKKFFAQCVWTGVCVKFFYWLLIPDVNNIITYILLFDVLMCVLIVFTAFFFMLPLHKMKSDKYVKCSVAGSVSWIIRAALTVLGYCVLAYFISVPVVL